MLKRPVSTEELQGPGGRFARKSFTVSPDTPTRLTTTTSPPPSAQVVGDAVGWGFVVRGNGPCHIQAVEPSGPAAAAAGLKVGIMGNVV